MTLDEREDTWLRAAFAAPLPEAESAADTASCPEPATVWEAVHGGLPASAMREVVEHVARCAACAEEWRLAMALGAGGGRDQLTRRRPDSAPGVSRRWVIGIAATLAVAALVVPVLRWEAGRGSVERGVGEAGALGTLVLDGAALPREDFRLRWRLLPEARSYDVEVWRHSDSELLFHREGLPAPEVLVPASSLKSAEAVDWQVTANLPDGRQITSDTFINTVR